MFADVQFKINYGNQILVPQDAVLDSGNEQTVFVVHDGGNFEPRKVTIGATLEGKVVVLSGLKAGETIVTSGNFLIDSESRMKSATARCSSMRERAKVDVKRKASKPYNPHGLLRVLLVMHRGFLLAGQWSHAPALDRGVRLLPAATSIPSRRDRPRSADTSGECAARIAR